MNDSSGKTGDELFIVDNSDENFKVREYLKEWADYAQALDIATGYFEIGAFLSLEKQWEKIEKIRILMGDEVTARTRRAILESVTQKAVRNLNNSIEAEKENNDFLAGVPAIVEAMAQRKIECRVYAKKKFHAKAYITHTKSRVVGSTALVGSSNFTLPGLTDNVELNVQLRREVDQLQQWFETHWEDAEDVSDQMFKVIQRHTAEYAPFEVYARALRELMRHYIPDVSQWEKEDSKIYPILAKYQQQGYASLMQIANNYGGAFLCDGVGLGK
ncbi:MAG: phospholipase D-like domain-containing protein, partial [Abditibacteriaceae bacterium]